MRIVLDTNVISEPSTWRSMAALSCVSLQADRYQNGRRPARAGLCRGSALYKLWTISPHHTREAGAATGHGTLEQIRPDVQAFTVLLAVQAVPGRNHINQVGQ